MGSSLARRAFVWLFAHLGAAMISAVLLEALALGAQNTGEAKLALPATTTLLGLTFMACSCASAVVLLARSGFAGGKLSRGTTALSLFAAATFAAHLVAQSVIAGAWIKQQAWASLLARGGPPLAGFVLVSGLAFCILWRPRRSWLNVLRAALTLALGLWLAWINASEFPGQYAALHRALIALSSLLCVLPISELLLPISGRLLDRNVKLAVALTALTSASAALLGYALRPSDAIASALLLGSERAGYVLPLIVRTRPSSEIYAQLAALDMNRSRPDRIATNAREALPQDTNVILIVVDTLRADTLPPAREQQEKPRFSAADTPFLSSLVARSYRFERAYGAGTMTRISMPSMFRSRQAFEESTSSGEPLAVRMSGLGLYPIAVVGQHFIEPTDERMAGLLEGFAEIEVYPESRQDLENPMIKAQLERLRNRPFFAWLHYYATHYEGFAGKRLEGDPKAWPENYPRTVRWVDGQIRELMATLDALDLTRRTLIVFTSDHGEGLMDTGQMWHGESVLDEAVRVPLSFMVPGRPGAVIEQTVGNIDIVPTILDLLGKESADALRGKSLVPLFEDPKAAWDASYYIEADRDKRVALVRDGEKHIFDRGTRLHMHFNLDRDASEEDNVFDALRPGHRRLLGELVELRPELFRDGLADTKTQALLDQRLSELDPKRPPEQLDFLLELVRLAPSERRLLAAEKLFKGTSDERLAARVFEHLYESDPARFRRLLSGALRTADSAHTLQRWIEALSLIELAGSARGVIRPYLSKAAANVDQAARPWFALVSKGSFAAKAEVAALAAMLKRATSASPRDPVALRLGLVAVAESKAQDRESVARLTDLILPLLDDPRPNVEAAACRALGALADERAIEPLKRRLYREPFVVRLGAMHGLSTLLGHELEPDLLKIGREPGYTLNVVVLLERIGTLNAVSFLDWVANHGERPFTMKKARQVRKVIQQRAAKAG